MRNASNHLEKPNYKLVKESYSNKHWAENEARMSKDHIEQTAIKTREIFIKSNPVKIVTMPHNELSDDSVMEKTHHIINQGNRDFLYK